MAFGAYVRPYKTETKLNKAVEASCASAIEGLHYLSRNCHPRALQEHCCCSAMHTLTLKLLSEQQIHESRHRSLNSDDSQITTTPKDEYRIRAQTSPNVQPHRRDSTAPPRNPRHLPGPPCKHTWSSRRMLARVISRACGSCS